MSEPTLVLFYHKKLFFLPVNFFLYFSNSKFWPRDVGQFSIIFTWNIISVLNLQVFLQLRKKAVVLDAIFDYCFIYISGCVKVWPFFYKYYYPNDNLLSPILFICWFSMVFIVFFLKSVIPSYFVIPFTHLIMSYLILFSWFYIFLLLFIEIISPSLLWICQFSEILFWVLQ